MKGAGRMTALRTFDGAAGELVVARCARAISASYQL
jgi:hypothetical protein